MIWQKKLQNFLFSGVTRFSGGALSAPRAALPYLILQLRHSGKELPAVTAVPDAAGADLLCRQLNEISRLLELDTPVLDLPEAGRGRQLFVGNEVRRARALHQVLSGEARLLTGSVHSLWGPAPVPEETRAALATLKCGLELPPGELLDKLVAIDYDDEYEATVPGEFARRGGIIDVYSPAHDFPCRIEYFGDEIESLRAYDPVTQRSTGKLQEYRIIGRGGVSAGGESAGRVFDYLSRALLVIFDPDSCSEQLKKCRSASGLEDLPDWEILKVFPELLTEAGQDLSDYPVTTLFDEFAGDLMPDAANQRQSEALKLFRHKLANIDHLVILGKSSESLRDLQEWCGKCRIAGKTATDFAVSTLDDGVLFQSCRLALVTEKELSLLGFSCRLKSEPVKTALLEPPPEPLPNEKLNPLADLDVGDYAVHIDHGIGIFRGVKTLKSGGLDREVLVIEYRDGQLFYVPLLQAGKISRYLGSPGKLPLHRLNSNAAWERDKENARKGVRSYAADMLRMQAVRQTVSGLEITPDPDDFNGFLKAFTFEDTPDQTRSTWEIARDMSSGRPMDRLLCGDVGYGKTELAMRAAFIAAASGYQVAVLAPTTILAQQHYQSFRERFASYPFTIDVLNRFKSESQQLDIISRLKTGALDIVIGTHRLCSDRLGFANLGLVIIDEEQRFGVNHKEKLRRFRTEVNVLTMSATPIPRTLYLAMAGARDLSTLTTAPKLRTPVKTVISPNDEKTLVAAISAEVARGGQVFYLHNRVKTIESTAAHYRQLLPECRIAVAHAQMPETQLEETMDAFIHGRIDCLFCTTIIESGLDVPNANTIIIERADRFGLAELYQLRGRVGRWKQQAYAYLLLDKQQLIGSDARKRLAAIKKCSSQGAGFQLALHDLEIRGSGNLLGAEQSGHLNKIGFDLYCHLLKLEVAKLTGKKLEFRPEVDLWIDFVVFAKAEKSSGLFCAVLDKSYIGGERLRINIYRRCAALTTLEELNDFALELADRFGKLPVEAENLLKIIKLKLLLAQTRYRMMNVVQGIVTLQTANQEIYRDERSGKRPHLDYRDAPALRIAHLERLLLQIRKEEMSRC